MLGCEIPGTITELYYNGRGLPASASFRNSGALFNPLASAFFQLSGSLLTLLASFLSALCRPLPVQPLGSHMRFFLLPAHAIEL